MDRVLDSINQIYNFSEFLKSDFEERRKLSNSYSLRKYASELDTDDSSLSQFMRGKRKFSPQLMQSLGRKLGLKNEEITFFISKEEAITDDIVKVLDKTFFQNISDWRFDAVLELLNGQDINSFNLQGLAERLSTSKIYLQEMIDFLLEHSLLKKENGRWLDAAGDVTQILNPHETNQMAKTYQKNILKASLASVDNVDVKERNHTNLLFLMNSEDMAAAIGVLRKVRRTFIKDFQNRESENSELYSLQMGLFPILKAGAKHD